MSLRMPEGFKRFQDWCESFDSLRKSGDVTLSTAAHLMKEMAEALDYCREYYRHIPSNDIDMRRKSVAAKALQSFMEWK